MRVMTARASALARTLVARMETLEAALLDDAMPGRTRATHRRQELVAEVLLSEAGVTDLVTAQLVAVAMPRVSPLPSGEVSDRELRDLATFIDEHVRFET